MARRSSWNWQGPSRSRTQLEQAGPDDCRGRTSGRHSASNGGMLCGTDITWERPARQRRSVERYSIVKPVLSLSKGEPELNGVTCLRSRYGTNRKTGRPRVTAMDGRADHPNPRLCGQPTLTQAHRGGVRAGNGSGEFAFGCCTGQIWQASTTPASTSPGPATTKWARSAEMAPPNSSPMAPSMAKSAITTATKIPSSPENGLLQQPARALSAFSEPAEDAICFENALTGGYIRYQRA